MPISLPTVPRRSRRAFLASAAGATAALLLNPGTALPVGPRRASASNSVMPRAQQPLPLLARSSAAPPDPSHLAWVWGFRHDGAPALIRDVLSAHRLGIVLKTHDGTDWMSEFDPGANSIDGPNQVMELAHFFEQYDIPFHAWTVVQGHDPVREAELAAQVLDAGARSLFLDLEAHTGFWSGSRKAALRFGEELRRQRPDAWLSVSVDARPWQIARVPLAEFASFTDEIAPQTYWGAFDSRANLESYREWGEESVDGLVTPSFVLEAAVRAVAPFGLPVHPIGDGTVADHGQWTDFVDRSLRVHAESVSVWRFGVTPDEVWQLLAANPPRPTTYVVQHGDTLSELAEAWHTDTSTIAQTNGFTNPNLLYVGQRLRVPRSRTVSYVVQPGDTLSELAEAWHTDTSTIAQTNGFANPNLLYVGQRLQVPRNRMASTRESTVPTSPSRPSSHIVQAGDTLWSLARKRGTTVEAITAANGITNASQILVGQLLLLP